MLKLNGQPARVVRLSFLPIYGLPAASNRWRRSGNHRTTIREMVMTKGTFAIVAALLAILAATVWWGAQGWTANTGVEMTKHGYIAMGLGIFFSLLFGCGLMALTFYSSRHGYDDLPEAKVSDDHDTASGSPRNPA
jgi:hypothetical protein